MRQSDLEAAFAWYWMAIGDPDVKLVSEYRFHPTRKWRFDFAAPRYRVAVEIEGGVYQRGRHNRPAGFVADAEKYNAAAGMGWRVIRLPGPMLTTNPTGAVAQVNAALRRRKRERWPGLRREHNERRRVQLARQARRDAA